MNKADREHLAKVAAVGCIVCLNLGHEGTPAEIHHPRSMGSMGKKAPHDCAIPLCHPHHRTGGYGVAIHAGQGIWELQFGTEEQLLEQVRGLINEFPEREQTGQAPAISTPESAAPSEQIPAFYRNKGVNNG